MKRYAIYDLVTGDIRRICQCYPDQAAIQPKEGEEGMLECADGVTDLTHRVEGGVLVPIGG